MTAKIPVSQVSSGKSYDSTPSFLGVSRAKPPYLALTLGDKVVTLVDCSGVYKEEGFFIPLDYGHIVGVVWVDHEVLVIGLANGYIILISAPLLMRQRKNQSLNAPGRSGAEQATPTGAFKAMTTTRLFNGYLSALTIVDGAPAALGDTSLKVLNLP